LFVTDCRCAAWLKLKAHRSKLTKRFQSSMVESAVLTSFPLSSVVFGGSRVSDVNPAELSPAGGRSLPDEFPVEAGAFARQPDSPKQAEREGLPPGYRMRADAHYVDQLTSRKGERAGGEPTRAARRAEPGAESAADLVLFDGRDRRVARDRRSDRILSQMTDDLTTIESAAALLAADPSPAARRVSIDLVRAHAWRAAFLVRANAMLDLGPRGAVRARPLGAVLGAVRDGFAPECRISTVALHIHVPDWNASVAVDELAVVDGVTGAVFATLGLLGSPDGATVNVTAAANAGELRSIEVAQDEVGAPPAITSRFFDPTWTDRPGGWTAALAAATARAVVQHHGGEAALIVSGKRGTTIRLTFAR
jgi:hypothetical protein